MRNSGKLIDKQQVKLEKEQKKRADEIVSNSTKLATTAFAVASGKIPLYSYDSGLEKTAATRSKQGK